MTFTPSSYQQAIFEQVQRGDRNIAIEAVAGSGKTISLVKSIEYVPSDKSVCFLAFNKHIATELQSRVPANARASTQHSLGFSNLRKQFGRVKVDEFKVDNILDALMPMPTKYAPYEEKAQAQERRHTMKKLISMCKALLLKPKDDVAIQEAGALYDLDLGANPYEFLCLLPRAFEMIVNCTEEIDFDDMLYLPVYHGIYPDKFDVLLNDEGQDYTPLQIEFALNTIKLGGMVITVGDTRQAIYGFRYADIHAMSRFVEATNAIALPLSITYRCPLSHVALAQQIVPQIEARPDAPDGIVADIPQAQFISMLREGDMTICRTNAPLIPAAFQLIRSGVKATVRGRDIGKNLADLARKIGKDAIDMEAMYDTLDIYEKNETLRITHKPHYNSSQLQALEDKVMTLEAIMAESTLPGEVPTKIETLFSDNSAGIVLSSVHKAKGLEANRVFILEPGQMPHPLAKKEWEITQEYNIKYIALTRSRAELYFVR